MKLALKTLAGIGTFLVVVAIMSRLLTFQQTPQLITNGSKAVTNLFNGAFFS